MGQANINTMDVVSITSHIIVPILTNHVTPITSFEVNKSKRHDLRCITDSIKNLYSTTNVLYQILILLLSFHKIISLLLINLIKSLCKNSKISTFII